MDGVLTAKYMLSGYVVELETIHSAFFSYNTQQSDS